MIFNYTMRHFSTFFLCQFLYVSRYVTSKIFNFVRLIFVPIRRLFTILIQPVSYNKTNYFLLLEKYVFQLIFRFHICTPEKFKAFLRVIYYRSTAICVCN